MFTTAIEAMMKASSGQMDAGEVNALMKALTATPGGPDVSTLTGGAALRVQSLDKTMQATIAENSDFTLFNRLPKPKVGGTLDEWTEQNGTGGFLGGSTNTETGVVNDATGSYARRTGQVKFLTTRRQVSLVLTAQDAIADAQAVEYNNGSIQLLSDAEYLSYEGDANCVPTEFDGIYAQLRNGVAAGLVDPDHVIDMRGKTIASIAPMNQASATIRGNGNFGRATDMFLSLQTQADFDNNLDPAFRVALNDQPGGGVQIGAPVVGVRTSGGPIKTNDAIFIRDQNKMTPFEQQPNQLAIANAQNVIKPAAVAVAAAADVGSAFAANQAGNYYYLVTGQNAMGQSTGLVSSQVAVSAGQSVTLSITGSASGQETAYVIYRSRMNGNNVVRGALALDGASDFREMLRIPAAPASVGVTVYKDQNRDLPGASKAFVLNMMPGATAINWRQLMPMARFDLYPTNTLTIPWAQLLFGYLRISKLRHHVVFKNIIPLTSPFQPFNPLLPA